MRITIYQPRYFPQLHYFNRMIDADAFVFLDNAQYTKSLRQMTPQGEKRTTSFQSDTPIKIASGHYMLTIPVHHEGYSALNRTKLDYSHKWTIKHLSVIKFSYQKSSQFSAVYPELKKLLSVNYLTLAGLNMITTLWALAFMLNLNTDLDSLTVDELNKQLEKQTSIRLKRILLGSRLGVERPEGLQKGTEWTTDICLKLGATEYLHGGTAKTNYMNLDYYKEHGITPIVQEWHCREYLQQFGQKTSFVANLSVIDLLSNVDKKQAREILIGSE